MVVKVSSAMGFRLNGLLNKLRVSKSAKDFHDGHSYEKKKPVISEKQIPVPFPFVVLRNKAIVATSPRFENTFKCGQIDKISSIFPSFDPDIPKQNVKIGGVQYTAFNSQLISDDIQNTDILTIVYFVENEIANPENYQSEKTVVALIFIDNYEEVLSSIEEVRRPLLLALIDKRLNTLAQQVSGILRKFEKDRYLFIFSYDKLNYLKKKSLIY